MENLEPILKEVVNALKSIDIRMSSIETRLENVEKQLGAKYNQGNFKVINQPSRKLGFSK